MARRAFEVEFAPAEEVERTPADAGVSKAVLLLMNTRARREAVACMDKGEYAAASGVIRQARQATAAFCAAAPADEDYREDFEELSKLTVSLGDRAGDRMSRKLMQYASLLRSTGRKSR